MKHSQQCSFVDDGGVRVLQGKGRKQRWTAISEVALASLRTYLEDFRGWSEGHLFQTFDGRAASQSSHERHVHSSRREGLGLDRSTPTASVTRLLPGRFGSMPASSMSSTSLVIRAR